MNKEELFECLSGLSKTNNLRDGIDIRKEEANIIVNEIERLNNIINKAIEFIYENAYDEERKICIDDLWSEIPKLLDILKGSNKDNV